MILAYGDVEISIDGTSSENSRWKKNASRQGSERCSLYF